MKTWWASLQLRERRILSLAGALVAALLYWLLLLRPLEQARTEAIGAISTLQQANASVSGPVAAILSARKSAAPRAVRSLFALVDSSAREAGLMTAQTRVEPLGEDRVRVTMEGTNFDQMAAWLETLDRNESVDINEWSVDRALVPGLVNATMTLKASR